MIAKFKSGKLLIICETPEEDAAINDFTADKINEPVKFAKSVLFVASYAPKGEGE